MRKTSSRSFRTIFLTGASAIALSGAAVGISAAFAQSTNYNIDFDGPALPAVALTLSNYLVSVGHDQNNYGATIPSSKTVGEVSTGSGPGTPVVSSNTTYATGIGNRVLSSEVINLINLGASGSNDGLGVGEAQLLANNFVSSTLTGSQIGVLREDFTSGSATVSNNSSTASTTLNQNAPGFQVSGELPLAAYTGTTAATITGGFTASTGVQTETVSGASVAITNAQFSLNSAVISGSTASIDNADIGVTMTDLDPLVAFTGSDATLTIAGNDVAASYAGNSSANVFSAEAGGGTSFTGSVAVNSTQATIETGTAGPTDRAAYVTGSAIGATVTDGLVGTSWTYTGALTLSDNSITADAVGNSTAREAGSGLVAGNAIVFADGLVSVTGPGTGVASVAATIANNDDVTGAVNGNLLVTNVQSNQGTLINAIVDGESGDVSIGAVLEVVGSEEAGASLTLTGNEISSSAASNLGANVISADVETFDAAVASGNLQITYGTPVLANTLDVDIGVQTGVAQVPGSNPLYGDVTLSDNVIGASAQGNVFGSAVVYDPVTGTAAAGTIDISAATLTGGDGVLATASLSSDNFASELSTNADAGFIAASSQAIYDQGATAATVQAVVNTAQIGAQIGSSPSLSSSLADGTNVTLTDNAIVAEAGGNVSRNGIALSGLNGDLSAATVNNQDSEASVLASIVDATVQIYVQASTGGIAANSANATLSGTDVIAGASGNAANNTLVLDGFANLAVGIPTDNPWTKDNSALTFSTLENNAQGALVVASSQRNEDDVTGNISTTRVNDPLVGIVLNGSVDSGEDGFAGVVSDTTVSASAVANLVSNTLGLDVGNLTTHSGTADQIATLSNVQLDLGSNNGDGTAVSATINASKAPALVGIQVLGDLDGSDGALSGTVSGTDVLAYAAGNVAGQHDTDGTAVGGNRLIVTGTSYASTTGNAGPTGISFNALTLTGSVNAEFALQNAQVTFDGEDGDATRSASIVGGTVGIQAADIALAVNGATLGVSGNSVAAVAHDNDALNVLALGTGTDQFASLTTSAALQSLQLSEADVSATINAGLVGIDLDGEEGTLIADSTFVVSGNEVGAFATVNQAENTLVAGAENVLSGTDSAGTDVPSAGFVGGDSTVDADYSLANAQIVGGVVNAAVGATTIAVDLDSDSATTDSTATVSDNSIDAVTRGNVARNVLSLNGLAATPGNVENASAALSSIQDVDDVDGGLSATASTNSIGIYADEISPDGGNVTLTVSGNGIGALAVANEAANTLEVAAVGNLTGESTTAFATFNESGLPATHSYTATGDYSLLNYQELDRAVSATTGLGGIGAEISGSVGGAGSATISVTGNDFTAEARGNTASSAVTLKGGDIATTASLISTQDADVSITSLVQEAGIGIYIDGEAGSATLTVADNAITALASANSARNTLSANAVGIITGDGTLAQSSVADDLTYLAGANFALLNEQTFWTGSVSATVEPFDVGISVGTGGTPGAFGTSSAVVSGNDVLAQANANGAVSTLSLDGSGTGGATAALTSVQGTATGSSVSALVGDVAGEVSWLGIWNDYVDVTGVPQTLSNNSLTALATANSAENAMTVTSTSSLGGGAIAQSGNATIDPTFDPEFTVQSDYSVLNAQISGSAVSATVGEFDLSIGTEASAVTNVPSTVNGNTIRAQGTANVAMNSVSLDTEGSLGAVSAVGNSQTNSGTVTASVGVATVGDTSVLGITYDAITTLEVGSSALNVSGNSIVASAGGNSATNALNATAGAVDATATSVATIASVGGGVINATADYAVLNSQSNSAAISASVTNVAVGVMTSNSAINTNTSPITVANNSVVASAYGNSASNSIALSGLPSSTASAALTSSQVNTASVSATVTGVTIGSVGYQGAGAATVSGNSIGAVAVGNSVGSSVGVGNGL